MMKLLVSVRSVKEAQLVARQGVDLIDLKEPRAGALGALPPGVVRDIAGMLRALDSRVPLSATIGDLDDDGTPAFRAEVKRRVAALAACGVEWVKVGVDAAGAAPQALLEALAECGAARAVPVFIADRGLDAALVRRAASMGFAALMADTADKRGGSLLERLSASALREFLDAARSRGAIAGLAGSLRLDDLPALRALAPDYAGFRGAVCAHDRGGAIDAQRLAALVDRAAHPRPSNIPRIRSSSAQ